jgi:hypothetical protein
VRFHNARGIEIEALAAVPMHVASAMGHGPAIQKLFGCFQFATPGWLRELLGAMLLAALVLAGLMARRLRAQGMGACLLAAVILVLLTSKVLSPQYFVWASAAVALAIDLHPRRAQLAVALIMGLVSSQLVFPHMFVSLLLSQPGGVFAAVTHGLSLVVLAAAALAPMLQHKAGPVSSSGLAERSMDTSPTAFTEAVPCGLPAHPTRDPQES